MRDFIQHPETHCWIWQRVLGTAGYGQVWRQGKKVGAHRAYYEELVGPIPERLTIDHLCQNIRCVNPGHLEPVTQRINNLRSDNPAAINARKTHCIRGHEFTPVNTYVARDGKRACKECRRSRDRARYAAARQAASPNQPYRGEERAG